MKEIDKNEYTIRKATWNETSNKKFKQDILLVYNNRVFILNCDMSYEIALYEEEKDIYILYYDFSKNCVGLQYFGESYDDNIRLNNIYYENKEDLLNFMIARLL